MNILCCLGLKNKHIVPENHRTTGRIFDVKTCWWIKINTKPVRKHMYDGAVFPHVIYFTYFVDGIEYTGSRFVNWNVRCPQENEQITVFYSQNDPKNYAVVL